MEALAAFSLPIAGLRMGEHPFEFALDRAFFREFPDSPVSEAKVAAKVLVEKHPSMYVLRFDLLGDVRTECDRCLEPFDLPIDVEERLTLKFGTGESEDDDVEYIPRDASHYNVAQHLYEFTVLDIPVSKTHDDADQECDPEMLAQLDKLSQPTDDGEPTESIWDALKKDLSDN